MSKNNNHHHNPEDHPILIGGKPISWRTINNFALSLGILGILIGVAIHGYLYYQSGF